MKKLVYTAMFIVTGFVTKAQVKIGTTPTAIVSGAKLQIDGDATTTNPSKLIVTGTGNVGIGTSAPSTLLHVNSGTSNAAGTSPAFTLSDGSQANGYVLTSNASGGATWKANTPSIVYGTYGSDIANFVMPPGSGSGGTTSTSLLTPASITLPAGKWLVYIGCTVALSNTSSGLNSSGNSSTGGFFWVGYALSDVNTGTSFTYVDLSLGKSYIRQSLGTGCSLNFPGGFIGINNTTGSAKTFYVYAISSSVGSPTSGLYWY